MNTKFINIVQLYVLRIVNFGFDYEIFLKEINKKRRGSLMCIIIIYYILYITDN